MMFWKKWKNITKQEKAAIKVLLQLKRLVLKNIPREKIVSIYVGGSFLRREMTTQSDVDLWIITTDMKAQKIITKLAKLAHGKYNPKSGLSGYAFWELRTGKHSKQITRKRSGPRRFVKYMPNYQVIYGKKLNQKDFPTNTDLKDLHLLMKVFRDFFLPKYEKKEFDFQSILKQVFWLTDMEFKTRGRHPPHSWKELTKMAPKKHIVHKALKLRKTRPKDAHTCTAFIKKLKQYLAALKKEFGND